MGMATQTKRWTLEELHSLPILIVEVLSGSTRRRDRLEKRELYLDAGVREYWIIDPERRDVGVIRPGAEDVVATTELMWPPAGAATPLVIALETLFE